MPERGRLVAFEGIDGSGKSTVLAHVAATLRSEGLRIRETREETTGPTGEWVRKSIHERWDPLATTFLFVADRARHVPEMAAWQAAGEHVLTDRYLHSTLAYQGVALAGRMPDPQFFLNELHAGWCPLPDHVLLLQCDPARAVERTSRRGATTPYEKVEFLTKVQAGYARLARADPGRFTVISSDGPLDSVVSEALAAVRKALH